MKEKQWHIPILPPYKINEDTRGYDSLEALLPFFDKSGRGASVITTVREATVSILSEEKCLEEKIMKIIKEKYPHKILIPSSYLVGCNNEKVIYLDVKNYGFLGFPGGKGDGSVLAELLDMKRDALYQYFGGETDIQKLRQMVRSMRVGSSNKLSIAFHHLLSSIDLSERGLPRDNEVKEMLGFSTQEVQLLFNKRFPGIDPTKRLDCLLAYTPETFREILSREYAEETGRKVISASLYAVLLEEKGLDNLLKVRMYYTGSVGKEEKSLIKHTSKEEVANMQIGKVQPDKIAGLMQEKIAQKLAIKKGYEGKDAFQFKKTSTAFGHYLACLVYNVVQQITPRK